MQPNPLSYSAIEEYEDDCSKKFYNLGELNEVNKLHGRGIRIWNFGGITIGYFENDELSTGNYIDIYSDGVF